jgi:hypothetical protein
LFIAVEAFFNIVMMSSFAFPFYLEIMGKNFFKLGECRAIMICSVFASAMRKFALFLISFDRLLIVSFPLMSVGGVFDLMLHVGVQTES